MKIENNFYEEINIGIETKINYLSVANRYRFMREEGTDECTQGE